MNPKTRIKDFNIEDSMEEFYKNSFLYRIQSNNIIVTKEKIFRRIVYQDFS